MEFKDYLLERLHQVDSYLSSSFLSNRQYALGRVLEIESMAFSLRNADVITAKEFERVDQVSERIRTHHNLHGDNRDRQAGRAYGGGRFDF
ncbi:hypothetical protein D9M68_328000 [compost metagenome]